MAPFRDGRRKRVLSLVGGRIPAVGRRPFDLLGDPQWSAELPVDHPCTLSPRQLLVASLASVVLLMASMALPWFKSSETPSWTPFSHWLDLGWSPGTRNWGLLVLALSAAVAIAIGVVIPSIRKSRMILLLCVATALVVTTLLESTSDLSVDPGPNLSAYYGAWIGDTAAVLAWICIAIATHRLSRPLLKRRQQ